jgi:lipopolysaccharide transport system ATP-binding protein
MAKPSVVVEGVSKKFGLSLRSALKYGLVDSWHRLIGRTSDHALRPGEFWALDDVSFSLQPGQALGIMGVNGSGKTTLLRILNGTYSPDRGWVTLRGRIGALIAAGAGFSPMLSGRENIYISGTLLGMSPREIRKRFDEIVAFAELGDFIDMPVRNYSSGMGVRLGFAIAVIGTPEILLVDEVLAVGDLNFQKKCYERIHELRREGTTILLVSHSPGAIWSVCDRGLFLDHGRALVEGSVEDVVRAYNDQNARNAKSSADQMALAANSSEPGGEPAAMKEVDSDDAARLESDYGHARGGTGDAVCLAVRVLSASTGEPVESVQFGEPLLIEYRYRVQSRLDFPIFRSSIDAVHYKFVVSLDSYEQGSVWDAVEPGEYVMRVFVKDPALRPGMYRLNTSIASRKVGVHTFYWLSAASFVVTHPPDRFLYSNDQAIFFMPCSFTLLQVG